MSWTAMFWSSFSRRQKLILASLLLPPVAIICFVFWKIPEWNGQDWKLSALIFTVPFIYYFQKQRIKYTNKIIIDQFNLNRIDIFDERFRSTYGIRLIRVYLLLKVGDSLKKEKIEGIISALKFETSILTHQFFTGKLFYALFILIIGIVIPKAFELWSQVKVQDRYDNFIDILSYIVKSMGLVVMMVFLFEWLIKDTRDRLLKNRYKVNLIRYLEEIKLLLS